MGASQASVQSHAAPWSCRIMRQELGSGHAATGQAAWGCALAGYCPLGSHSQGTELNMVGLPGGHLPGRGLGDRSTFTGCGSRMTRKGQGAGEGEKGQWRGAGYLRTEGQEHKRKEKDKRAQERGERGREELWRNEQATGSPKWQWLPQREASLA